MELQRQVAKGSVCRGGEETDKSRGTARGHPGCLPGAPQALASAEITALRRGGNPRAGQEGEQWGGLPAPRGGDIFSRRAKAVFFPRRLPLPILGFPLVFPSLWSRLSALPSQPRHSSGAFAPPALPTSRGLRCPPAPRQHNPCPTMDLCVRLSSGAPCCQAARGQRAGPAGRKEVLKRENNF